MKDLPSSAAQREQGLRVVGPWTIKGSDRKVPDRWPVFIEIVLGGVAYRTKEKTIRFLQHRGLIEDGDVERVIRNPAFEITKTREDHKLGLATPKSIGLPSGGTLKEFCKKAKTHDLVPTSVDAGPQIMLQVHSSWTKHDSIVVVSKTIVLRGEEKPFLFEVSSSHLKVVTDDGNHIYGPDQPFLLRRQ